MLNGLLSCMGIVIGSNLLRISVLRVGIQCIGQVSNHATVTAVDQHGGVHVGGHVFDEIQEDVIVQDVAILFVV